LGIGDGLNAGGGDGEKAFGSAAALRRGIAEARGDEAFLLQAVEGGV
jgi:hypothetical protein